MKSNRTYKYRIYPNKTAVKFLNEVFHGHRCLYNRALEQRITAWKETKLRLSYFDQTKSLNQVRKTKYPKVNCTSFCQTLRRLDHNINKFFRTVKKGKKAGFPRFKSESRFRSVIFVNDDGARIKNGKLVITWCPYPIRIKWHRELPEGAKIKQLQILRKNDRWYLNLIINGDFTVERPKTGKVVGVDLGLTHLATTSDGKFFDSPKYYINSQKRLRRLERAVSRKKKFSKSWKKAVKNLARFHEHIVNQRKDFLHKLSYNFIKKYDGIVLEDLDYSFMLRYRNLAKSSRDVAMGTFVNYLEYKAESAGVQVIKVDPRHTSQICSACGKIVKKDLWVRKHKCECGLEIDRDINAARNILMRGASSLDGVTWFDRTSVPSETVGLTRGVQYSS